MARKRISGLTAAAVVLTGIVFGCATTSFTKNAYNTLATAAEAYDTTMTAAAELYEKGRINDTQRDRIIEYGEHFWLAYHVAVDALAGYHEGDGSGKQAAVYTALSTLSTALGSFLEYAQTLTDKEA